MRQVRVFRDGQRPEWRSDHRHFGQQADCRSVELPAKQPRVHTVRIDIPIPNKLALAPRSHWTHQYREREMTIRRCAAIFALFSALPWCYASVAEVLPNGADQQATRAQPAPGIAKPVIISRGGWRAKAPGPGMEPQTVTGIIL